MEGITTREAITQKIRDYLFLNFLFGYEEDELDNDASFLEFGLLDSTGILELVAFIEEDFEIEVDDLEIIPDNMDSINKLSRFVARKIG